MTSKECEEQLNSLVEAWQLNEADLNQTDIEAIKHLMLENQMQHNVIAKLNEKWEALKEKINGGYRVYRNRGYDLVFEIDEVPKEELNDFICYLATQTMQEIINKIEVVVETSRDNEL